MPESIWRLIQKKYLKNHNQMSSSLVCRIAKEEIEKTLKSDSGFVKVLSFDGKRLKFSTKNSLISHKLKMFENKIKKRIKKRTKLRDIDFIYSPNNAD